MALEDPDFMSQWQLTVIHRERFERFSPRDPPES
jgi:hypothetical protein